MMRKFQEMLQKGSEAGEVRKTGFIHKISAKEKSIFRIKKKPFIG